MKPEDFSAIALVGPSARILKAARAYRACEDACIPLPKELVLLFPEGSPNLMQDSLLETPIPGVVEFNDDSRFGWIIGLDRLPAGTKQILITFS